MKKRYALLSLLICCLFAPLSLRASESTPTLSEDSLAVQAKSAYLMEYSNGKEIYAKKAQEKLYPASMTKMMGLLLVYEQLNSGALQKDELVTASETAASMGGSQIYLEVGEAMSVEELLRSVCIASANDAMVALAERVGGTHEGFVEMMNAKAKELKLEQTHFVNATGLHDPKHYSCAKDMAIIARALIQEGKDDLLAITSTYDAYIREKSDNPFWLVNTNKLLKQMDGADGLKTGYTTQAGSCITVSAQRDGLRLIGVVMGEPDSKTRNQEAISLMEYGFSHFEQKQLYQKGDAVEVLTSEKGKPRQVGLVALQDVSYAYEKGKESKVKQKELRLTQLELPYETGKQIASLHVTMSDGYTLEVPLGVKQRVEPLAYLDVLIRSFRQMFG